MSIEGVIDTLRCRCGHSAHDHTSVFVGDLGLRVRHRCRGAVWMRARWDAPSEACTCQCFEALSATLTDTTAEVPVRQIRSETGAGGDIEPCVRCGHGRSWHQLSGLRKCRVAVESHIRFDACGCAGYLMAHPKLLGELVAAIPPDLLNSPMPPVVIGDDSLAVPVGVYLADAAGRCWGCGESHGHDCRPGCLREELYRLRTERKDMEKQIAEMEVGFEMLSANARDEARKEHRMKIVELRTKIAHLKTEL